MAASHEGKTVFLCHAGENKTFARQLVDRLETDGLNKDQIFYDEISLQPGDELDSIIKVIESPSMKLFVFVLSKYCFQSNKGWIRAEWEAALENKKQIFPIWLDDNNDGFKAFGYLVREFSYKLRKTIAQRVNLQEISTSLPGLSGKICALVCDDEPTQQRPPSSTDDTVPAPRQSILPANTTATLPQEVSIECKICCYTFKNPKDLPCLHTFCEHCLQKWVQENDGDTFPCPICRQPFSLPENGVSGLKDNFYLTILVKTVAEYHEVRHGKNDLLCKTCEEGKPATSRCSECAEFLCESCESAHRLLRATKAHTLFTFEELKTGKYDSVFRARRGPLCSKHSGEILKLYCRTCETPICNECALFEHRDSQHDYTRIEKVAAEKREEILDLTPQCQARMQFFRQTEEVQKRLKEQLQQNAEGARQNVTVILKEEGERLLTCIDAEETSKTKRIEAEIEGAQISLTSVKSVCEFAETLARERGDYEVVRFSQDMTTRLKDLTRPPSADTVDIELANITVDYTAFNHKLRKSDSPQTVQYHLSESVETSEELCSLLHKSAPQRLTICSLRPSEPSVTTSTRNVSRTGVDRWSNTGGRSRFWSYSRRRRSRSQSPRRSRSRRSRIRSRHRRSRSRSQKRRSRSPRRRRSRSRERRSRSRSRLPVTTTRKNKASTVRRRKWLKPPHQRQPSNRPPKHRPPAMTREIH